MIGIYEDAMKVIGISVAESQRLQHILGCRIIPRSTEVDINDERQITGYECGKIELLGPRYRDVRPGQGQSAFDDVNKRSLRSDGCSLLPWQHFSTLDTNSQYNKENKVAQIEDLISNEKRHHIGDEVFSVAGHVDRGLQEKVEYNRDSFSQEIQEDAEQKLPKVSVTTWDNLFSSRRELGEECYCEDVNARFFIDSYGNLGVAPGNAQALDTIYRFPLSDVVLVVRRSQSDQSVLGRAVIAKRPDEEDCPIFHGSKKCLLFSRPRISDTNTKVSFPVSFHLLQMLTK